MEGRQNGGERCKIVQDYVRNIDNDQERPVCYLYMNNYEDFEIRKILRISQTRLNEIKEMIRLELIKAGIRERKIDSELFLELDQKCFRGENRQNIRREIFDISGDDAVRLNGQC